MYVVMYVCMCNVCGMWYVCMCMWHVCMAKYVTMYVCMYVCVCM
jgi:hypothetical protein